MRSPFSVYISILMALFKDHLGRQKRKISAIIGLLFACWIGGLFWVQLPDILSLPPTQDSIYFLEAGDPLYFQQDFPFTSPDLSTYYHNHGYEFEVRLFDYRMHIAFETFFNYSKPLQTVRGQQQIVLEGDQVVFADVSQLLEKEFSTPLELDAYLLTLPLPLHVWLNQHHHVFWIVGFQSIEEGIKIIPPYAGWSEEIILLSQGNITQDYRLQVGNYIEKSVYLPKSELATTTLTKQQLALCQHQHCFIQQANVDLFSPTIIDEIKTSYIYTPLNPFISGIYYENARFYVQHLAWNQQEIKVEFQLDNTLVSKEDIGISQGLASYLGVELKSWVLLSGNEQERWYRVAKIVPEDTLICYQSSRWTVEDLAYLAGADPQEYRSSTIYLFFDDKNIPTDIAGYLVRYSHANVEQEIAKSIDTLRIGLLIFVILSVLIQFGFVYLLFLFEIKEQQGYYQLFRLYGYSEERQGILVALTNGISYLIAWGIVGVLISFLTLLFRYLSADHSSFLLFSRSLSFTFYLGLFVFHAITLFLITFLTFLTTNRQKST